MPRTNDSPSVREVWQLAFPPGTELVGGSGGLNRGVEWVATLRAAFPLFGELNEGYVALADMSLARQLDSRLTIAQLITQLRRADAVGLVVKGEVTDSDAALADTEEFALFRAPDDSDLHVVERDILRALVDRQGQAALREAQVRQGLQEMFARGGIQGVLNRLAEQLSGYIVVSDDQGSLLIEGGAEADRGDAELRLPVRVAGRALGTLSVYSRKVQTSPLDIVYAEQAAEICGIDMLQRVARQETEDRIGAELIAQLVDQTLSDDEIQHRFVRLGYGVFPQQRHVVLALGAEDVDRPSPACVELAESLRWAARHDEIPVVIATYRAHLLVFLGFHGRTADWLQRNWPDAFAGKGKNTPCSVGVSRTVEGISGLRAGVLQALDAWALGQRITDHHSPYYYEDLGLYRLLAGLRDRDELRRFYDETLGALVTYDMLHETEMVITLEAFFRENANASKTARALYVHRNTLNYRLQRIQEITGLDLDDSESRLALQLSLKVHHLSR